MRLYHQFDPGGGDGSGVFLLMAVPLVECTKTVVTDVECIDGEIQVTTDTVYSAHPTCAAE